MIIKGRKQNVDSRIAKIKSRIEEKNKTNLASLALKASNTTMLAELSESHPDTEGFI